MDAYLLDWVNLLLRWAHLIVGIAWIGASFYFVMLDNSLTLPKKVEDAQRGVHGELWAVHGGGFYCSQKFLTGPKGEPLSDNLHWSKWEAYSTWITGMALLALIYWVGASTHLVDARVMALSPMAAVAVSIGFLSVGWIVYDVLCRNLVGRDGLLAFLVFVFVMLCNYGLHQIFSARGAYIHVGAMLGTMMAANVFFHIIPGQKRMVEQIRAGQPVDSEPGMIGKQRSVHNTYFTLPVLFIMISNHYASTYGHKHAWAVLVLIGAAGVSIRHFFNRKHKGVYAWQYPALGAVCLGVVAWWTAPRIAPLPKVEGTVTFERVRAIIGERCSNCHASTPTFPGLAQPPAGVVLTAPDGILKNAQRIYQQTIVTRMMPLGNVTHMTEQERAVIAAWVAAGATAQ
jgi:uncharacterized membrane protein